MKRLVFTFVLGALFCTQLFAQQNVTLKVEDKEDKHVLDYATVVVKDADGKAVEALMTDENGQVTLNNWKDTYTIEISTLGYEAMQMKVSEAVKNQTIALSKASQELAEVTLRAKRSRVEQKVDRKVIHVGEDLVSAGAGAVDVLNNVPSVNVDNQTGSISLRGNSNVAILIDGKPSNLSASDVLKQIPSAAIKTIEIITNPSAKYNPEGKSGMINIILNKSKLRGYNGSVNIGVTQGDNTRSNNSLNLNYRVNNFNTYLNYSTFFGDNANDGFIQNDRQTEQNFNFLNSSQSHLVKFGVDFYMTDDQTLSLYTNQSYNDDSFKSNTKISQKNVATQNQQTEQNFDFPQQTYNANYEIKNLGLISGEKVDESIMLDLTLGRSEQPENATFKDLLSPEDKTQNFENTVKNQVDNILANVDYTLNSEVIKVETGAEYRADFTTNAIETNQKAFLDQNNNIVSRDKGTLGNLPNSSFSYDRHIVSGYININQELHPQFSYQLGLRVEDYMVSGQFNYADQSESYTDEIVSLYPSAFLTYNVDSMSSLQFSYSRRVDRPSINQVNPIREWSTPLVISVGNPNLRQEFTNSVELSYTYQMPKMGSLNLVGFYRDVNNSITRSLTQDLIDPERAILSFLNVDDSFQYGFELSSQLNIQNFWMINFSTEYYFQELQGIANGTPTTVDNTTFNIRMSNSISLSKDWRIQVFGMYRGENRNIQFINKPMWMLNIGSSYQFTPSFSMNLNFSDVINGMRYRFRSIPPFNQSGQFNWENQTVYLGLAYKFRGGEKTKQRRRKRRQVDSGKGSGGII